jgi:hypothetical protein
VTFILELFGHTLSITLGPSSSDDGEVYAVESHLGGSFDPAPEVWAEEARVGFEPTRAEKGHHGGNA